ncbi:hypothetical protein D9758_003257 [Tetrapyrgos nigripes]|uniref:Hamartin n=1 Tax=Tetrapyrgos nigripes TaxID=182062 RepID=A0A8H5LQI8_9AGAR|nr:hypothetical protein D9758_003257 [Tetrapyrgos nigripes]
MSVSDLARADVSDLARRARLIFSTTTTTTTSSSSSSSAADGLLELCAFIDDFVAHLVPGDVAAVSLQAEHEFQAILDDVVDHSSLYHVQVLLTILYHLRAIITPLSIISSWFDLALRPALREPKLPTHVVSYAKELILSALYTDDEQYSDKVSNFLRLLFDLYLLDAFNEGSNEDFLEWAALDHVQKERKSCWKSNLEDILLRFGEIKPHDLMTELYERFSNTSSRLQLTIFMNLYVSNLAFEPSTPILAAHPLMTSLLHSVLLDNSTTCCTVSLTVLVKLLPLLAVHASKELVNFLPVLFAILARISSWKRISTRSDGASEDDVRSYREQAMDVDELATPELRPELQWQRLESTFDQFSPVASLRPYFTLLYYLFPSNLLKFLREPARYLLGHDLQSPYTLDWDDVLQQSQIRSGLEPLLQQHLCHSMIVWNDDEAELSQPFWTEYDAPRILTSAMLLDARNAKLAFHHRDSIHSPTPSSSVQNPKPKISLQEMVTTSILLKSNLDIETEYVHTHWPSSISSSSQERPYESHTNNVFLTEEEEASQALPAVPRELLLLRNELNFELWLSRENMRHIGRLWQDKVFSQSAEVERQGLYNKLRNYRTQVVRLESELKEHKELASSAKHKYADWNTELQKKLREFREEKKTWQEEAAKLRMVAKEAEAKFSAQEKLLAEAHQQVFQLQTYQKENQHKIDRLRDYEKQIQQYFKTQCLWDEEFAKFNARGEEIERTRSAWKQMEQRLDSYEKEHARLEEAARGYRRQIQRLGSQLSQAVHLSERRPNLAPELASFAKEKARLQQANQILRDQNADLLEEMEELRAMVEVLRGQVSGKQGLVSGSRESPVF